MKATDAAYLVETRVTSAPSVEIHAASIVDEDEDEEESDESDNEEMVDSPPHSKHRSKLLHDPAGGRGKTVDPSTQTQKRTRTSSPEPTKKVAKQPKVAPPKARKTLPRIKMDVPVDSG